MVFLLGASSYIGRAFANELLRRGRCFVPLTREAFDYSRFELLFDYVRKMKPDFLINATGSFGDVDVNSCESTKDETLWANTILPQTVSRVCLMTNTPWGHVSSASIFSGVKVVENGRMRVERHPNLPEIRQLYETHPQNFYGFEEVDTPNFSFRNPPCSFYSGTKALAEEAIRDLGSTYIWRIGKMFSENDEPGNLLSRLQIVPKVYDATESISHVDEAVRACLNLWDIGAAFGIYHVANPGLISIREIVGLMEEILSLERTIAFWKDDNEFYRDGSHVIRSQPVLNVSRLLANGVRMRPVREAVSDSLNRWRVASTSAKVKESATEPLPAVRELIKCRTMQ